RARSAVLRGDGPGPAIACFHWFMPARPRLERLASDRSDRRSVLSVGVLERDFPVPKVEEVATVHLDSDTVAASSRECPLGHAAIAVDEVPRVSPVRIGKGLPDRRESGADRIPPHATRAPCVLP